MVQDNEAAEVTTFLKVARMLAVGTANAVPKKVNDSLVYLVERAAGFESGSAEALAKHLGSKATAGSRSTTAKKPSTAAYFSADDLKGVVSLLEVASVDPYRFKDVVDQYNKDLSADAMKAVASAFARAPKPKTKADAVRLLVAARNERQRIEHKAKESETSNPW